MVDTPTASTADDALAKLNANVKRRAEALALNTPPDTIEFQIPIPGRSQIDIKVPREEASASSEPVWVVVEHITREVALPAPTVINQLRTIGASLCYRVSGFCLRLGG